MAHRIDKLTPEQHAQMIPWRDAWIARGLSTEAMNDTSREKAEKAIRELYRRASRTEPKVVIFVPSPLVLRIASGIAAGVIYAHRQGWPAKDGRAKAQAAVRSAVRSAVGSAVRSAVGSAVRSAVGSAVDSAVDSAVRSAVGSAVDSAVGSAVDSAVGSAERPNVVYLLECAARAYSMERGGNLWSGWPAYMSFFRDVCGLELAEWEAFAALEVSQTECGPYSMHEDFAMVSDRPSILKRAPSGQLHSDDGPAIAWRDGWSLYFWKGLRIPGALIEKRHEMKAQEVLAISNAEERRAGFEIYGHVHGPHKALEDLGAELIAEDEAQGRPRRLYAIRDTRYLHVINGSLEPDGTRREFLLGAHPEAATPHEAVAVSYGRPAGKYKEAVRT